MRRGPYSLAGIRAAAIERIHQDELDRMDAILQNYEIEKANAKMVVWAYCQNFGHASVNEWVRQHYEGNR